MNVGHLEEILAMLPKDMPVHITTDSGGGCRHITRVDKQPRRRQRPEMLAAWPRSVVLPDGTYPPALVLRAAAGAPLWFAAWADDVPFDLTGRWPAEAHEVGACEVAPVVRRPASH